MTKRFLQSQWEKAKKELLLLNPDKLGKYFFYSLLLLLPVQVGLHFWPDFAYVQGIRIDYLSPILYLTDILVFVLLLMFVFGHKQKVRVNIYFAFFISLILVGAVLAQNYKVAFFGFLKLLEFSFVGYYVYKKIQINSLFLKALSASLIFESLLAIFQFLNRGSMAGIFYFFGERTFNSQTPNIANANIAGELILRPYATFPHPNVLAGFLLIGISFIVLFAGPKIRWEKIFYFSTIGISAVALCLTLSRIAIIGLLILSILKTLESIKDKSIKNLIILIAAFSIAIIILLPYSARFTNFNFSAESFTERKELTIAAVSMTQNHLLFGVGLNNFLGQLPSYYRSNKTFYLQPVHNIFLLVFSQAGIIAGTMFILFLVKLYRRADPEIKFILILVILLGFFDHYFLTLQQGQLLLSVILGLSLPKIIRR